MNSTPLTLSFSLFNEIAKIYQLSTRRGEARTGGGSDATSESDSVASEEEDTEHAVAAAPSRPPLFDSPTEFGAGALLSLLQGGRVSSLLRLLGWAVYTERGV